MSDPFARLRHAFEDRPDGTVIVTCEDALGPVWPTLGAALADAAASAPDRAFIREREGPGWRDLTYGAALGRARRLGSALRARALSAERPLAILSGASIDHAALALGAMLAGIPYAPVSPAYSNKANGFARLRDVVALLTPGMVFVDDAAAFAPALAAAVPPEVAVVAARGTLPDRTVIPLAALEAEGEATLADAATPDTIAKFLFTSGSTGLPKAVITTHRMLCANAAQLGAAIPLFRVAPPVLADWLPWHHVFGGSHNFGLALFHRGTLAIDPGRPVPGAIAETVRTLRDVSPTCYLTVPKGYEALLPHLRSDPALRERFFARLELAFFAAAGLPQPVWDAFDAVAASAGRTVPMVTGLGATESAPCALLCGAEHARSGRIGLPVPEVTLKLAPVGGKVEARLRGPNVTPGYWRRPDLTAAAFDEERFYRLGDAVRFAGADRTVGLVFDGRLAEDFKLSTGVWVSVGPLRARLLDAGKPYLQDVAVAGEMRDDIRLLLVPDAAACRGVADAVLRTFFAGAIATVARSATGSATRPVAGLILAEPPSMDAGEITDKGSINQRALLARRAADLETLYADPAPPEVIWP